MPTFETSSSEVSSLRVRSPPSQPGADSVLAGSRGYSSSSLLLGRVYVTGWTSCVGATHRAASPKTSSRSSRSTGSMPRRAAGGRLQRGTDQRCLRRFRPGSARRARRTPTERRLAPVRWGLVPSWAKEPTIGNPDDQRPGRDAGREAGLQAGVRQAPVSAAGRRLLRVVSHRTSSARGQAAQAAVLHPPRGRRCPGDGGAVRDLARQADAEDPTDRVPSSGRRR